MSGAGHMAERARLAKAKRVVVKIGSRLVREAPAQRARMLAELAAALRDRNGALVVVSSGAIALGVERLQLDRRPTQLPELQACAAIGQGRLMHLYDQAFTALNCVASQVLLTHEDLADRQRYLNARQTLNALLSFGSTPIINENDTVSVDEITFGDNDQLASLVAPLCDADLLIVLTDVDGLCDRDPADGGVRVPFVENVDHDVALMAGPSRSGVGRGGMASKVQAAKIAGRAGIPTVICSGQNERAALDVIGGADVGTLLLPSIDRLSARKHWIGYTLRSGGVVTIDSGAARAVGKSARSLLPSGVLKTSGDFAPGETVSITDENGAEIARGLSRYSASELVKIAGRKSDEIAAILGYHRGDEVVHRDDLVVL